MNRDRKTHAKWYAEYKTGYQPGKYPKTRGHLRRRVSWWYNIKVLGALQHVLINHNLPYRWVNRLGTSKGQFL